MEASPIRRRPKKKLIDPSARRSSKVYEPSIDSLCNESILAELLQTPVPWKYKDLYASSKTNQVLPDPKLKKQVVEETQIWKMAGILDQSREGLRSEESTSRSTERSPSSTRSNRLTTTGRASIRSSSGFSSPIVNSEFIVEDVQQMKPRSGPPPERYIVAHMLNYRRFIKDERWWDTHGLDLPLGGNDKRKLMVLRYGMRVPFPVETVFRWFEEIMTALRLRAEAMVRDSPWRSWTVSALVVLLREYGWSNDKNQQLIHEAQAKGLTSLCILAHRWGLRVVEEREWRPASRLLVVNSAFEAVNSETCPLPRDAAIDERLKSELTVDTSSDDLLPLSPLPFTSGSDWSDLGAAEALSPSKHVDALHGLALRHNSRANTRMGQDVEMTQASRSQYHGGPGTGRDPLQIPPSAPRVGPLIRINEETQQEESDPACGAGITYTASATATDHLLAKIHKRETARDLYMKEVPPLEVHSPQTHAVANKIAYLAAPHSFQRNDPLSLNESKSVTQGSIFSPLVGKRAGAVGGGFGVGDGGGSEQGGTDWYLFNQSNDAYSNVDNDNDNVSLNSKDTNGNERKRVFDLPFPNFFPTDDLTGEGLKLRSAPSPGAGDASLNGSETRESQSQTSRSNRRRRSSVADLYTDDGKTDISASSSLDGFEPMNKDIIAALNDIALEESRSPLDSPLHTPKGSLAQQVLSPTFNTDVVDAISQAQHRQKQEEEEGEINDSTKDPMEGGAPEPSSLFEASDIAELSKPKAKFEPKHFIDHHHSAAPSRRASITEGLSAELEHATADRRAVQYLLDACISGNMEHAAEMFKTVGPTCLVHWVDGRGRGALHYASLHGHVDLCNWLLSNGAGAMAKDNDGRVPLHLAALNGHEKVLRALMNHPAARPKRPDPLDNFNRTPLHLAAWFGQKHTTEALLRNSANVNAKDAQGFTPLERASMARRTALLEFLQRQQILPLDFNTTFQVYHTYDEHAEVKREKLEEVAQKAKEREEVNAIREAITARAARSVELFHQSGVVPSLGPLQPPMTQTGGNMGTSTNQLGSMFDPPQAQERKRRRRPAPLPHNNSLSASSHPTAVVGGLDELLTDSLNFPFPRAIHLRNRRDREPSDSDSDSDSGSMTRDSLGSGDRNDADSIASDDYDDDEYLSETATSLEEHAVAVARAGGNIDGIEEIKVHVPGGGSAAELKSAELISKHVNEYLGGPQVAGVGAELSILFAATPVPAASFSRGKARSPGFVHTIASPTVDPGDITGAKARTRLRLLGGKHRSLSMLNSSIDESRSSTPSHPPTPDNVKDSMSRTGTNEATAIGSRTSTGSPSHSRRPSPRQTQVQASH